MYYLTQEGIEFLEEALTGKQKVGILGTGLAGLAATIGASKLGPKGSPPKPPGPKVVQQQPKAPSPSLRREVPSDSKRVDLQAKEDAKAKAKKAAEEADRVRQRKYDGASRVWVWNRHPDKIHYDHTGETGGSLGGGRGYTKQEVEHMRGIPEKHPHHGKRPTFGKEGKHTGYEDW